MNRVGRAVCLRALITLVVVAIAALLSYRFDETRGLAGCGIGLLIAAALCGTSHTLTRRAREASDSKTMLRFVFASVAASFTITIGAVVAVHVLWPPVVETATLTAIAVYLVVRFDGAVKSWSTASAEASASGLDPSAAGASVKKVEKAA
jgi:hypothetical protein